MLDAKYARNFPCFAIFYNGYELDASGYLLKPLLQKQLQALFDRLLLKGSPTMLTIRCGTDLRTIAAADIFYVESDRDRLVLHTDRKSISFYGKLHEFARLLPEGPFLCCHQSYLVNVDHVYAAADDFRMESGATIPIRVRERRAIRDAYFRYITEARV